MNPVIYALDENGEAEYVMAWFCCEEHRAAYTANQANQPLHEGNYSLGESADAINGFICDECGTAL